jgi:hypothetical protein
MRIASLHKTRRKRRVLPWLLAGTLAALGLLVWMDSSMRPAVESIVTYQTQVFAARL